ncbi:MAG: BMP family protein [Halanaerobiales bacterium]
MKTSNLIILILVAVLVIFGVYFFTANTPDEGTTDQLAEETSLKAAMVTDVGGLGDQSFNDAAWRGLQRAESELGVEIGIIESADMSDYVENLSSLAEQGYDMVWAIGFLMKDALAEVAEQYPDTTFGLIDDVVEAPNVVSVTFKEEEGSYLVGAIAGLETNSDKVGFIGGMEMPLIKKFEAGFLAGVKEVNPDAEVFVGYTGAFDDPSSGKELALTQYNQGADIIYHASGACGIGVIKAAAEQELYAIGVDSPQAHLAPYWVLTSMVKMVDVAVFNEVKALEEGTFEAGHEVYGLEEDGVGYSEHALAKVHPDLMVQVDRLKQQIIDGDIEVPSTPEEVE